MLLYDDEYILVFASHNQAVYLYQSLMKKGYKVELISTPCAVTAGCTQSIKFRGELIGIVKEEANRMKMRVKGIYKITLKNGKTAYEFI